MSEHNTASTSPQQLPAKVMMAFNFVQMMRNTACRHISHDTETADTTTVCKNPADSGAYASAQEVLRTWFSGENEFEGRPAGPEGGDDTPPGLGAPREPPAPDGTPESKRHRLDAAARQ